MPIPKTTGDRKIHDDRLAEIAWAAVKAEHPGWSVDELLLHPDAAQEICRTTRLSAGKRVDDATILKALLNARKRSLLK